MAARRSITRQPANPPTDLYHEGLTFKKCHANEEGTGLDPRAWAWLLFNHTPVGFYYDHYKYTSAYAATRVMGEQLRYQAEVAGALVNAGHHAFVFVGVDTSCDIGTANCLKTTYTISNVYVNDPWDTTRIRQEQTITSRIVRGKTASDTRAG